MTRILILHPLPTRGGFSAVLLQTKELLERGDFEVTVAVASGPRLAEVPDGATVAVLEYPLTSIRGVAELRRVVKAVDPDVVHLHGRKAGLIGRLAMSRRNRPIVLYTPHGTVWMGASWRRSACNDAAERLLLRRATYILCVSRAEQADWVRRDTSPRVRYFPNPLMLGAADCDRSVDSALSDEIDVLVPSGYSPQKRLEVVLEALALLPQPRPTVLVTGTADRQEEIDSVRARAILLGVADSITFGESVMNVVDLMAAARIVVLPSYSEGMPIVGEEAIVAGASVAWSAIPPHFELFADYGASFWTAEELAKILQLPRESASVAGRRKWQVDHQIQVRTIRSAFWDELKAGLVKD